MSSSHRPRPVASVKGSSVLVIPLDSDPLKCFYQRIRVNQYLGSLCPKSARMRDCTPTRAFRRSNQLLIDP